MAAADTSREANIQTSKSQPISEESNTTHLEINADTNKQVMAVDPTQPPQISPEDNTINVCAPTQSQTEAPIAAVDATTQQCVSRDKNIETSKLQPILEGNLPMHAETDAETNARSISADSTQTPQITEDRRAPMAAVDATIEPFNLQLISEETKTTHLEINAETNTRSISANSAQTPQTSPEDNTENGARGPTESQTEDWRTQSKQILILSESGKPIYCRCVRGEPSFYLCGFGLSLAVLCCNRERLASTAADASEMNF